MPISPGEFLQVMRGGGRGGQGLAVPPNMITWPGRQAVTSVFRASPRRQGSARLGSARAQGTRHAPQLCTISECIRPIEGTERESSSLSSSNWAQDEK